MAEPASSPLDHFVRVELAVRRRLDGRLHGEYRGLLPGHGSELGEAREYRPGDDVRRIDWAVTARTNRTHVRETVADHELTTVAVVDLSASLDFGTARQTKRVVALDATAAIGFTTAHGANRFGALALHGGGSSWMPPAQGRAHVHAVLRRLRALRPDGAADLAQGLRIAARLARRHGFVAVVSDFLDTGDWPAQLRGLGQRHELLAVEIVDPRELRLPDVGFLTVTDPETGSRRHVDTADPVLRARYAAATDDQRARIAAAVRRAGADLLRLRTDSEWLADMLRHIETRRRNAHVVRGVA